MRVLGFDPGAKKTGIAVGNRLTGVAEPIETWLITSNAWSSSAFSTKITSLINTWKPTAIVVGITYTADGIIGPQQKRSQQFHELMTSITELPVRFVDERLSSHYASERLKALPKKQQNVGLDAMAAAIIIETHLAEV